MKKIIRTSLFETELPNERVVSDLYTDINDLAIYPGDIIGLHLTKKMKKYFDIKILVGEIVFYKCYLVEFTNIHKQKFYIRLNGLSVELIDDKKNRFRNFPNYTKFLMN